MQKWIEAMLDAPEFSLAILPALFLLGLLVAVSNCCTPTVVSLIAGYSGAGEYGGRRAAILVGVFFLVGTVAALAVLGAVTGFVSQIAGSKLGSYWKIFGGLVAVLFGLATLGQLPFRLPRLGLRKRSTPNGPLGASIFGFAVGGTSITCTLCCNPLLGVPLGVAALQGKALWGAGMLTAFGVGYSLPFAAVLVGLQAGFGKLKEASQRAAAVIKTIAGVVLIAVGFYLLATV
ncbi:MAG: cytochrome c biogenesis protein CcdA [Planctomycetota bacterium]